MISVLLSASVERCFVSRMWDFLVQTDVCKKNPFITKCSECDIPKYSDKLQYLSSSLYSLRHEVTLWKWFFFNQHGGFSLIQCKLNNQLALARQALKQPLPSYLTKTTRKFSHPRALLIHIDFIN